MDDGIKRLLKVDSLGKAISRNKDTFVVRGNLGDPGFSILRWQLARHHINGDMSKRRELA
jgi:hypothetical protein